MAYILKVTGIGALLGRTGYLMEDLDLNTQDGWDLPRMLVKKRILEAKKSRGIDIRNTVGMSLIQMETHPQFPGIWPGFEVVDALWKLCMNLKTEQRFDDFRQLVYNWDLETPIIDKDFPQTVQVPPG